MPVDYSKGKIYAIRSHQTDKVYIGSTTQELSQRMAGHKRVFRHYLKGKHNFVTSFELLKFDDAYIELIKNCPCSNKEELLKCEGQEIRRTECVNKVIPDRGKKEFDKEYYEKNKEYINKRNRDYGLKNKEKTSLWGKMYREQNKLVVQEKKKIYYQQNKDTINQIRKAKVTCECGAVTRADGKQEHFKSKKHQEHLSKNNQEIKSI